MTTTRLWPPPAANNYITLHSTTLITLQYFTTTDANTITSSLHCTTQHNTTLITLHYNTTTTAAATAATTATTTTLHYTPIITLH